MSAAHPKKHLVLAAMLFVVAMTFIDMTIVSIAIPEVQKELGLSSTGVQWVVNAYLLALAATFGLGGRLADVAGQRTMVLVGVVVFVLASIGSGATPTGDLAEPWIITFRAIQGIGAALLFPAAVAIIVRAFPVDERGRALAVFFGVAGGLTAIGPILGGWLVEWSWRSVFFVNVPVAILAIVLTLLARPVEERDTGGIDWRGALLVGAGMALSVLGLQQSTSWGWTNPATWGAIAAGLVLLVVFVRVEAGTRSPVMDMRLFGDRQFSVQNVVLFLTMIAFVPVFFFASMYAQIALGWTPSNAGLYLLIFFAGFVPGAQVGGRMLDKVGAKRAIVVGALLAGAGFALWAWKVTDLSANAQWPYIVMAGAGMGMLVSPSNTDALNRAPARMYGMATGITQTVRNFGSSLGMAVLGTVLVTVTTRRVEHTLEGVGLSTSEADHVASSLTRAGGGSSSHFSEHAGAEYEKVFEAVQTDFAYGIRWVLIAMAIAMAVCFVVGVVGLRSGNHDAMELPATSSS